MATIANLIISLGIFLSLGWFLQQFQKEAESAMTKTGVYASFLLLLALLIHLFWEAIGTVPEEIKPWGKTVIFILSIMVIYGFFEGVHEKAKGEED